MAIPADSPRAGLKSANITTSLNADVLADYKVAANVDVEGANGYTAKAYKIYKYAPAQLTAGQTHKLVLA